MPFLECNPQRRARNVDSEASMGADPEGKMLNRLAIEVDSLWIAEDAGVAAGGAGKQLHAIAGADQLPVDLDVRRHQPSHVGEALVAQQLLDRVGNDGGVFDESLPVCGVL